MDCTAYLSIDRVAQSIDNATEETRADWDVDDGTSTPDDVTLLDGLVVTENDNTDIVGFQVQGHTLQAR